MSDEPAIETGDAQAAEPITPETEAPAVAPEAEEADPFAPVAEGEPAQFPREYVEKLRREGAKYRTAAKEREQELERLKPLDGLFEGYEPEAVDGWRQFIGAAAEDPQGALAYMVEALGLDQEAAGAVLTEMFAEAAEEPGAPAEAPAGDEDDLDRPMTRREFLAMQEREQAEAAQAAEISSVKNEAKELGYDPEAATETLEGFRYQRLLHLAMSHGNDLTKAHEALEAEEQALVKSRMDALAQEADALPTPTGNGGPAAATAGVPDWKKTREAATEFVRASLHQ